MIQSMIPPWHLWYSIINKVDKLFVRYIILLLILLSPLQPFQLLGSQPISIVCIKETPPKLFFFLSALCYSKMPIFLSSLCSSVDDDKVKKPWPIVFAKPVNLTIHLKDRKNAKREARTSPFNDCIVKRHRLQNNTHKLWRDWCNWKHNRLLRAVSRTVCLRSGR